jgi:hypothetical protein
MFALRKSNPKRPRKRTDTPNRTFDVLPKLPSRDTRAMARAIAIASLRRIIV